LVDWSAELLRAGPSQQTDTLYIKHYAGMETALQADVSILRSVLMNMIALFQFCCLSDVDQK
jgi:hypothetical protein